MTSISNANNADSSCTALNRTFSSDHRLVLVVEDHEDTRFLLRIFLERRGMLVAEAEDGEAGVHAAEELHPDLILMDWKLPGMDGLAATRLIHECDSLRRIPIVFISGYAAPESQEEVLAEGCCEYLVKPLDLDCLDRVLRKHLLLRVVAAAK